MGINFIKDISNRGQAEDSRRGQRAVFCRFCTIVQLYSIPLNDITTSSINNVSIFAA